MKHRGMLIAALLLLSAISGAVHRSSLNPLRSEMYRFERAATETNDLMVRAYGPDALMFDVVSRVGGVLFQGTATSPAEESWWVRTKRFFCDEDLEYDAEAPNGERYTFHYACESIPLAYTDEFFAPIIEFVESDHTAAVTLFGAANEPTREELARQEELGAEYIVQFHPAFKDTLIGNMLLLADAAFVDPTVAGAQELWNEPLHLMFPGLQQGDPTVLVDAASTLGEATSAECVRPESYIVLDVDTSYEWTVSEGQLSLSGAPYYSFWCQYPERGMAHHFHTLSVADVKNGAPYIYETVIQVGRASAFLRWYRAESLRSKGPGVLKWFWDSSENWEDLVAITREVSIEGHETPGFWSGHNPLLMFLMEALRQAQEGEDASE